jgi:hypothetical protein
MTDDSLAAATETTDLTSAPADTSPVDQTASGDTAAAGSAPADTPASDTAAPSQPNTSGTAPTDPLDKVGTFPHGKAAASANPITPPANAVQPPTWDDVAKKLGIKDPKELDRIAGMTNLYGRQANEVGQLRQQLTQLQQEQQAAQQRAQEEAQRLNLSPFHSRHPQHAQNTARVQAFGSFKAALQGLPPELQNDPAQRARLAQAMGVTADDEKLYQQQEVYSRQIQQELQADPEGFVEKRTQRLLNEQLQKFEQYLEAKVNAQGLIQQHQPLIEKHAERMNWMLDPNIPAREKAIWAAQQEAKIAELLNTKVPEAQHVETLKARSQLASRQVAPTRAAAAVAPNPFAEYEKRKKSDPNAQEALKDAIFGRVE